MSTTSTDTEAKLAELKNAPMPVRRIAGIGALLGLIVFFSFCASAFSGHTGWGRALASGVIQFLLLWYASFSILMRQYWAWWLLLALVGLRVWGGFGHTLRLVRLTLEGGLANHGREILFDLIGLAQLIVSGILLWLLFSRTVREFVRKAAVKPVNL
jgi:hypothetical protein